MTIPAHAELDRLCGPDNWRVIGVSALVYDQEYVYLEIAGPRPWQTDPHAVTILLGCVGGHLEPGEQLLDCLAREAHEEIGVELQVRTANETRLVFGDRLLPNSYKSGDKPLPWLLTVGPNRLPDAAADAGFLVIVTYLARSLDQPTPRDLFGLLSVPRDALRAALPAEPMPWQTLCRQSGATLHLCGDLPAAAHLLPALTARSIRILLQDPTATSPFHSTAPS